jgi:hypothetical protein
MATVIGDVMFPGPKYIKDGEEKTKWINCGILLQTDNGMRLKLESLPLGIEPGGAWFSIFEKREEGVAKPAPQAAPAGDPESPF